jgi:hypothetical protein
MQHVRASDGGEREHRRWSAEGRAEYRQNRAQPERELVQVEAGGSRLDIGERGKGRVAGVTRGRDTLTGWPGWTAASKGPEGAPRPARDASTATCHSPCRCISSKLSRHSTRFPILETWGNAEHCCGAPCLRPCTLSTRATT